MENNNTESGIDKSINTFGRIKTISVLIFIVIFILGGIGGLLAGMLIGNNGKNKVNSQEKVKDPILKVQESYDPSNIITGPVFTEWMGAVEGEVISKTERSFTIQKGDQSLEIYLQPALSLFFDETQNNKQPPQIQFESMKVGSYVRGGVTISKGTLTDDMSEHIFANGFSVINAPNTSN